MKRSGWWPLVSMWGHRSTLELTETMTAMCKRNMEMALREIGTMLVIPGTDINSTSSVISHFMRIVIQLLQKLILINSQWLFPHNPPQQLHLKCRSSIIWLASGLDKNTACRKLNISLLICLTVNCFPVWWIVFHSISLSPPFHSFNKTIQLFS